MIGRPPVDPATRFDARVTKTETCWLWGGHLQSNGYAMFQSGTGRNAERSLVHRWNYERLVGPIPSGWQIDHLCGVRNCVNPGHLEAVPGVVNNARSQSPSGVNGRLVLCAKGLHELSGENLHPTYARSGIRRCKECCAEYQRQYRARRRNEQKELTA